MTLPSWPDPTDPTAGWPDMPLPPGPVYATVNSRLAAEAEKYSIAQLSSVSEGHGRAKLFGQIGLARARLRAGEAEQACDDGDQALRMAESVSSAMIRSRLRDLLADSEPYAGVPRVLEFRDRLRGVITGLN